MNKKGFTVVEVIVSFILISLILTSLITFAVTYREKIEKERIKTELVDFKNTITKIVYDDIVSGKLKSIDYCDNNKKCVRFLDQEGNIHELSYLKITEKKDTLEIGEYLIYDDTKYFLPESNNNSFIDGDFELKKSFEIDNLVIKIKNTQINYEDKIMLTIN